MTNSPLFGILLSIGLYAVFVKIQKKTKSPFLNPLILASIVIIVILKVTGISYNDYAIGGNFISMLIGPATVALAIPLYQHFDAFKRNIKVILISILTGSIAHAIMIALCALVFTFDKSLVASLVPKSVTTAIAVDISSSLGGMAPLTLSIVVLTGILGALLAPMLNKLFKFDDPITQGLSLGVSAHAVGTSKAVEMGEIQGVMSSLALVLTGVVTVILSPFSVTIILRLLG